MSVVDVFYDIYRCPHCIGKIILCRQVAFSDGRESYSLSHTDKNGETAELFCESFGKDEIPLPTKRQPIPRKHEFVQLLNPRSHRWVKLDKTIGGIVSYKKSPGPYKNTPIVGKGDESKPKRTIKTPPYPPISTTREAIQEAVNKLPPRRIIKAPAKLNRTNMRMSNE